MSPEGGRGPKVPHVISRADGRPFFFAGIWEEWTGESWPIQSFTILTTDTKELIRPIHDRLHGILGSASEWNRWIDSESSGRNCVLDAN